MIFQIKINGAIYSIVLSYELEESHFTNHQTWTANWNNITTNPEYSLEEALNQISLKILSELKFLRRKDSNSEEKKESKTNDELDTKENKR